MSEERDFNLGRVIKNADYKDKKDIILKKAQSLTYSQPMQRLAHKVGLENNLPTLQYSWIERNGTPDNLKSEVMTLSTVTVKGASANQKTIKPHPSQLPVNTSDQILDYKKTNSSQIGHPNLDGEVAFSSFTLWLNQKTSPIDVSLNDIETNELGLEAESEKSAKIKAKKTSKKGAKRAKSKKKSAKRDLQKKIEASVEHKESIASESLAKLYHEQGFYKKSLKMYKQLSLINPEKSSFFAPFIEELKNKLK